MSIKKDELTIILVSFKSRKSITKIISKINKNLNIIIVENSNDKCIKNY